MKFKHLIIAEDPITMFEDRYIWRFLISFQLYGARQSQRWGKILEPSELWFYRRVMRTLQIEDAINEEVLVKMGLKMKIIPNM